MEKRETTGQHVTTLHRKANSPASLWREKSHQSFAAGSSAKKRGDPTVLGCTFNLSSHNPLALFISCTALCLTTVTSANNPRSGPHRTPTQARARARNSSTQRSNVQNHAITAIHVRSRVMHTRPSIASAKERAQRANDASRPRRSTSVRSRDSGGDAGSGGAAAAAAGPSQPAARWLALQQRPCFD